jgi:nicotinate dehydrogenase subunit B
MTGLLHEKEFSRKSFVKAGGALIVGFSLAGAALSGKAKSAVGPFGSNFIDQSQVDSWITVNPDNTASIKTGGIRQGTGSDTALLMIAGEELNMAMSQLEFVMDDTSLTPNTGPKDASNTIKSAAGLGVRAAAASAAQALLGLAAAQLGVPAASLSVSNGVVSGGGKTVTYGQLIGGKLFNVNVPSIIPNVSGTSSGGLQPGAAGTKPTSQYTLVGTSPPRIDIPGIVTGSATYIQNVRVPGMLHGRWVRPRGQGVYGFGAQIVSIDASSIAHIPNAKILQKGNFIGVVAPLEYNAIQGAAELKVAWATPPAVLPGNGNETQGMRALDSAGKSVQTATVLGNVDGALASAAHVVTRTYAWATNLHAPIGPCCAVADVTPQGTRVFNGTQGAYKDASTVAAVLGVPVSQVRVTSYAMSGPYGNGAQYRDAAASAALMSQLAGAPVRVQFMRWDEMGWDNTAPGTLMDIKAGIDANGNIVGFDMAQFYPQYQSENVERVAELTGSSLLPSSSSGATGAPFTMYHIANSRYLLKSLPLLNNWMSADWMRHGAKIATTFAAEQVIDELAHAANMDPVAFRLQNIDQGPANPSLLAVMTAVTQAANWQPKVAASNLSSANIVTGRGMAWYDLGATDASTKMAAVADVSVNKKTGKVTVEHVYQAFSSGLLVYPGGVANQSDGGITQVLSRLLWEQLRYSKTNVTGLDWVTYPIMRFKESPKVTSILLQRSTVPTTQGVGQEVTDVAAAAVANAFFDATGVRMPTAPFTPARVRAALAANGAGTAGKA